MKYKQLGKSDLTISAIGFGCMSLQLDERENEKIIHKAVDFGINFFDTADLYDKGMNEMFVGKALQGKRDKVIIATKVGNQWRKDGSGWDWNPKKDYILSCAEQSLKRLQTDYIDLYQLHGGTIDDPIEETIDAFEILKKQGKIRHYGISSIRPNVIKKYVSLSNIVSVMMQYSLLDRRPEEVCLPLLQKHQIGVLARGSVANGLLVNKPAKSYLNYDEHEVRKAAKNVKDMSTQDRSAAQTAIQFVSGNSAITSAVVGIRTLEQLKEAAEAISATQLSTTEREELTKLIAVNYYTDHRE
ncbi:aldo/keto reductase [Segetibacter sp.]|jgi:aryl-alcohol dehydrogenase-like predicted oxidoreductase|uniref:aldo/keto reductase n=1 Tax=Segetibacter sp. TaxID=2231182 RepID=UPI0026366411|nr:aldo/keto reductase [Segetibacter sp.]MCW3079472.1 aldo/keto reductase [Segetibacter sp.]